MAFKGAATSGIRSKKYFWLGANWGQSIRIWLYVTTDTGATVAASGYIDDQGFIDSLATGDLIVVLEVGSVSDSREVIDDISDGGLVDLTLHVVTENTGTVVDLSPDLIDGQDGQDAGLTFDFDDSTSMADPGTGNLRLNNATLSSVTAAAIDDLSAVTGNPDVSAYILTWDDADNAVKGTLTITKNLARQNFAIFHVTGLTDNSGWTQLALTHIASNGSFDDEDGLVVSFVRSGDDGEVAGPASSTTDNLASFADTTGEELKDSGIASADVYRAGGTDVAVADGGTGASTASGARTNLGLEIGSDVQAHDTVLDSISGLAADGMLGRTAAGAAFSRELEGGDGIDATNGTGTGGNPSFAVDATVARLNAEDQALTGGAIVTSKSLGTQSSGTLTLDMGDRPLQHYTNGGAHTLAPGTNTGSALVDIVNNASAGAITTSGFTQVSGDDFTTTDGDAFRCHVSVGDQGSLLEVRALQ